MSYDYRIQIDCNAPDELDDASMLLDEAIAWAEEMGLDSDEGSTISVEHLSDEDGASALAGAHALHKALLEKERLEDMGEDAISAVCDVVQRLCDMGAVLVYDSDRRYLNHALPGARWRAAGWNGTVSLNNGIMLQINMADEDPPLHPSAVRTRR